MVRNAADELRDALDAAADGVFALDADWRFSYVNAAAERFLGRPRDALLGQSLWDALPESRYSTSYHEFTRARTGQAPARFEKFYPAPGLWAEVRASPWRGGLLVLLLDASERRRAQEERGRDAGRRAEQLQREVELLQQMRGPGPGPPAAPVRPLRESVPEIFADWVARYGVLLELALEQRVYRVGHPTSPRVRALSRELGQLRAGPRDVIELHTAALKGRTDAASLPKSNAYIEEGQLLVLELMGELASYYRARAAGRPPTGAGPENEHE